MIIIGEIPQFGRRVQHGNRSRQPCPGFRFWRAGVRHESGTDIVAALTNARFAPEADIRRRDNLVGAHGLRRGLEIMHAGDR
jgi:hypothetical protein